MGITKLYILKAKAVHKHGLDITPTIGRGSLDECFTIFRDRLIFWFNTPDHSTHVETQKLNMGDMIWLTLKINLTPLKSRIGMLLRPDTSRTAS